MFACAILCTHPAHWNNIALESLDARWTPCPSAWILPKGAHGDAKSYFNDTRGMVLSRHARGGPKIIGENCEIVFLTFWRDFLLCQWQVRAGSSVFQSSWVTSRSYYELLTSTGASRSRPLLLGWVARSRIGSASWKEGSAQLQIPGLANGCVYW